MNLFRPTDDNGVPRRFQGHGEAFAWVSGTLARLCDPRILRGTGYAIVAWVTWTVVQSVYPVAPDLFPTGWGWVFIVIILAALVTLLILGIVVIYLYLVLAGSAMRREE